jgi:hypothetical protein
MNTHVPQRKQFLWTLALTALTSLTQVAQAAPIFSESEAYRKAQILTLYPDSRNPNKFYFIPNSSGFARMENGLPAFGFTYWGLKPDNAEAGAYMTFTTRLAMDPQQREALTEFLQEHPRAEIAVVPIQSSMIGLNTSSASGIPLSKFFEEWNLPERGGRAEDEVGANTMMTKLGAKVMLKAIENPQALKLDYCYKVQGLGPNFRAVVTADLKWVYDYFSATVGGGGFWFKGSVTRTVEKLISDGRVKIDIEGGTPADETFARSVAERIVERVFKVDLEAKPGPHSSPGGWSFSSVSLNSTHREQFKSERWEYERRELIEREFCLPLKLGDITPYKDRVVKNADEI